MTTASNTVVSTRAPAATGRPAAATQRQVRDEAAEDVAATGGVAFDLVLDTMRGLARAARAGFEGRASAAQVFEPVADDAHGHRQSSLENEYHADVTDRSDGRQAERNGLEARRQAKTEVSSAFQAADARAAQRIEEDRSGGLRGQTPRDAETVLGKSARRAIQGDASGEGRLGLGAGGEGRSPAVRDTLGAAPLTSPRGEAGSPRSAPSGVVQSTERSERPSGSGPAMRLARVLASGRNSGAEMARSTAVAPGSTRAGGRGESPTRAPNAKPGQARRFVPGEPRASGSSPRVDSSPFDELVRSMRLRTGTRYSSARIQLNPPELGRIQVDIRVVADRTRVEIRAENPAAKKLLERRGAQLSAALERQGIVLDAFEVSSEELDTDPTAHGADGASFFAEHQGRGDVSSGASSLARDSDLSATEMAPDAGPGIVQAVVSETRLDIRI